MLYKKDISGRDHEMVSEKKTIIITTYRLNPNFLTYVFLFMHIQDYNINEYRRYAYFAEPALKHNRINKII